MSYHRKLRLDKGVRRRHMAKLAKRHLRRAARRGSAGQHLAWWQASGRSVGDGDSSVNHASRRGISLSEASSWPETKGGGASASASR